MARLLKNKIVSMFKCKKGVLYKMKNKKYRPILLCIFLAVMLMVGIPLCFILLENWIRITLIIIVSFLALGLILCSFYWFEIKDDCVLISIFKTKKIMFDDIDQMDYQDNMIIIHFKNGNVFSFTIRSFIKKYEIIQLIDEVKQQLQ